MRLKIDHTTTYHFDQALEYGLQQLRLTPKDNTAQNVLSWEVVVDGGKLETEFIDQNHNTVSLVSLEAVHDVTIRCSGEVETLDSTGVLGKHQGCTPLWLFQRSTDLTRAGPNVRRLAKGLRAEHETDLALLHALSARVLEAVTYETGRTDVTTTADAAIEAGHGVCQDHAHIFIAAARALDIPARYISGYLMMDDREDQDASHAWAEAHVEGLGWVGFDISNGISPDERHIRVATGLDYMDAAPVSGLRFGAASEAMTVAIQVQQQ